jgi:LPXTG-site transpeptidase (sortase) family protein
MSSNQGNHRAELDQDGNIVLPLGGAPKQPASREEAMELPLFSFGTAPVSKEVVDTLMEEEMEESETVVREEAKGWEDREMPFEQSQLRNFASSVREVAEEPVRETVPAPAVRRMPRIELPAIPLPDVREIHAKILAVSTEFVKEGGNQYQTTIRSTRRHGTHIARGAADVAVRFWGFLAQPVWVPGRKSVPKKRSRGMLFVTDVARFGGTFAALFGLLFVTLNYQSFWEIMQSRLDPLSQTQAQNLMKYELADQLGDKLKRVPSLNVAGQSNGDLLSFLPPVGPPENRIVIPKLDLNAPIVIPSSDALMREDWAMLEENIQASLQDGVVHYPGTAKPGQAGNFFLTGHSSYFPWAPGAYKSIFARLHQLDVGDEYWVFYGGDKHRYVIQEKKEVKPSDVTVLDQPLSKRVSTLMTCTPVGTTLRRLIIKAQEVDAETGLPLEVGEHEIREQAPQHKLEMLPI